MTCLPGVLPPREVSAMDMPYWRWCAGVLLLSAALWLAFADLAGLALWGYSLAGGDALLAAGTAGGVAFMGLLGYRPLPSISFVDAVERACCTRPVIDLASVERERDRPTGGRDRGGAGAAAAAAARD